MRFVFRRTVLIACLACLAVAACAPVPPPAASSRPATSAAPLPRATVPLPNDEKSLKFGVLGDFGTGDKRQYALAEKIAAFYKSFPMELVTLVGDNIYGSDRPQDYARKFETPYAPLLKGGVKFYGSMGNHDAREQRFYKLFNMDGKHYYSFKAPRQDVRFFALESTYMEPEQLKWLEDALRSSGEKWKLVFFHHPLYSSGRTHGSDEQLRKVLEPLFVKYGVSVVLTGHDHIYERTRPQQGITYFVAGSGGKLRPGDFRPNQPFSELVVSDTNVFVAMEILDADLTFNAVAANGRVIDSGRIRRRETPPDPAKSSQASGRP
jgi:predicted MPP superfamily phosphohydrolase